MLNYAKALLQMKEGNSFLLGGKRGEIVCELGARFIQQIHGSVLENPPNIQNHFHIKRYSKRDKLPHLNLILLPRSFVPSGTLRLPKCLLKQH